MRSRYFVTILVVLTLVTAVTVVIHSMFQKNDRLELIDQQVRETAEALVDSKLGDLRKIDFKGSEKIISDELGEASIGKLFIVRDEEGHDLYANPLAETVGAIVRIPSQPMWVDLHVKGNYIRILNLEIPKFPDRTLTVGLVLDEDFVSPHYFSKSSVMFFAAILALGSIASLFLTSYLLRPLTNLNDFLSKTSDQSKTLRMIENVPGEILGTSKFKDEFQRMVSSLNALIDRVNSNYRLSRLWSYQMAHELKTPLSILGLEIERIQKQNRLSDGAVQALVTESEKISDTIGSFLSWAELENSNLQKRLFVNRLGAIARSVCDRFAQSYPGRVYFQTASDPIVVSSPQHLEQVLSNLIANALAYTDGPVEVRISNRALTVIDRGQGIPKEVIARMGEPFNRGQADSSKGHGLGLAWVKSICRLYNWEIGVFPSEAGSRIVIAFPATEETIATEQTV